MQSLIQSSVGTSLKSRALGVGLALLLAAPLARAATPAELLEKGIYAEETQGELKAAAGFYQAIIDHPNADRSLVAQAHLRLGLCELKLGNKPQAIIALDKLTQQFPDKDKLLALVEQHMPQVLDEIVREIERNYLQEVDRGELMETAIRAIVGKIDARDGAIGRHDMEFLGAHELNQVNEQIEQKFAGIGAVLKTNEVGVIVQSPLPGSPALLGGLRAGDRIVTINQVGLPESKTLETAVQLLRGPIGTQVSVGVQRDSSPELQEIKLIRNTIRLPTVLGDRRKADNAWEFMLDDQTKAGYVRLSYVGKESAEELRSALADLHQRGMRGLVLDLRNNPGGLLDGAVAVSDLFVESGRIVTVKGRAGETVYDATPTGTYTGFPIAVLVNRRTASAAEIIAACLQDHGLAVVVGERTFGQGIVRSLFPLKSGVGAVKIPIAAYYRPSGKSMNRYPDAADSDEWGVQPSEGYEVALTDEELKQYDKDRTARDVLIPGATPASEVEDRQLHKALEWVRAQVR